MGKRAALIGVRAAVCMAGVWLGTGCVSMGQFEDLKKQYDDSQAKLGETGTDGDIDHIRHREYFDLVEGDLKGSVVGPGGLDEVYCVLFGPGQGPGREYRDMGAELAAWNDFLAEL